MSSPCERKPIKGYYALLLFCNCGQKTWKVRMKVFILKVHSHFFSIFVLRWDVVKLIKNPFMKIKRQLMPTNFTLAMYKIA